MTDFLFKFLKFGVVGISGTIIDFSITWFCKEKLKWNKFLANSLGFTFAATSNYIFNRIWTFESTNPQVTREYFSFIVVSLIGLGINNGIIYLLHEKGKMNFYLAKVFAIGVVMIWNFLANYVFTFRQI